MKKIVFTASTLFAAMSMAQAQNVVQPSPLRVLAGIGISAGGDDLATARYTNGSSDDIKAGGGVYVTVGADYRISQDFSIQGTVNYHIDDTNANNGSIKFKRVPLELLGYYHLNNQWRLGAGVRVINGAKLTSSGAASGLNHKFDNSTGAIVEAEYFVSQNFGVKIRYVKETFKKDRFEDVKGNHVGISGNYYF